MDFIRYVDYIRKVEFCFEEVPVPYTRMTQAGKFRKDARKYLKYRNALADAIRAAFPDWQLPFRSKEKKASDAWLDIQRERYYGLGVNVYYSWDAGDNSNGKKVVEDALQCAGIIWDDKRIKQDLGGVREVDKHNPRIEFELRELKK